MHEFGTFSPTEVEVAPAVYYILPDAESAIERLRAHGVETRMAPVGEVQVEHFIVDSTTTSDRAFQGRNERIVFGTWQSVTRALPPGTVAVSVDQPLGRLAFTLLEPRSDDGFANWAILDGQIDAGLYPVMRAH